MTVDLAAGHWRPADGRSGTTDPFAIEKRPGGAAAGGAEDAGGADRLSEEQIGKAVVHVVQLSRHAPAEARTMLDNLSSKLGLTIDLSAKTWRTADSERRDRPFGVVRRRLGRQERAGRRRGPLPRHDERR